MYDHILIPLDRSVLAECVLPHGIALANAFDARLTLLQVVEDCPGSAAQNAVNPLTWQMQKAEADAYLEDVYGRLKPATIPIDRQVLEGKPAQRILEFSERAEADLILLSSHGESGLSEWNISSTVQKVISRAYLPVMIVRAYDTQPTELLALRYRRLLIPLDGSSRAECVLPLASTIARRYDSTLILAHVLNKPEMPRRLALSADEDKLLAQFIERNRQRAEKYLDDLAAELGSQLSSPVEKRLLVSEAPTTVLHEAVERENADLVVLSAHGYSGSSKQPYGSVTLNFIAYGRMPLLIVQDFPREEIRKNEPGKAVITREGYTQAA
ncbi:MAG: universal stress protein [Chloroflexota bacterium]